MKNIFVFELFFVKVFGVDVEEIYYVVILCFLFMICDMVVVVIKEIKVGEMK